MRRPYDRYRHSGVEWIGEIPEHWGVRRLKDVGRLIAGSAFPEALQGIEGEELPFYKVADLNNSDDGRWMSDPNHTISRTTADMLKARVVPAKAIVYAKIGAALLLNRRRLTIGSCCIDNNMSAYVPDNVRITTEWALYACCLLDFKRHVNPGAVPSLSEGDQSVLPILVPSVQEQQAIATFLDAETAKIDTLVAKNRLLLERLAEFRTALITRTVTKGLPPEAARAAGFDPNPPLKQSGVEWLGDIPEHWVVCPFKRVLARNDGGVWGDDPDGDEGTIVLRSTEQMIDGSWSITNPAQRRLSHQEWKEALLATGDLVVTKSSGSALHIGKTSLVTDQVAQLEPCFSNFMQRLRCLPEFEPRLAWYLINSHMGRQQLVFNSNTTTGLANLNGTILGELQFPMPPPTEQRSIAEFLDLQTERIDALSSQVETAIERLQEYRTALITATVTGKIDVREHDAVEMGASRT